MHVRSEELRYPTGWVEDEYTGRWRQGNRILVLACLCANILGATLSVAQVTWTPPTVITNDGVYNTADDEVAQVATDRAGNWVAVWESADDLGGTLINSIVSGLGSFLVFLGIAMIYPNGMGGGDVKLAGVIGLLAGYPGVLLALWLAVVSAGVIAIGLVVVGKLGRKDTMPFGPFLSLGAVAAFLAGDDIASWYSDLGDFLAVT